MDPEDDIPGPDQETIELDPKLKLQRKTRSLCVLTLKFIRLLQEAENGELDLRCVRELHLNTCTWVFITIYIKSYLKFYLEHDRT